jgi:hypothetical protein
LYKKLFEEWKNSVLRMYKVPMEEHVLDDVMTNRPKNSEPMVYYYSGWLLQRLEKSNLHAIEKETVKAFMLHNMLSYEEATLTKAPTAEVAGCM